MSWSLWTLSSREIRSSSGKAGARRSSLETRYEAGNWFWRSVPSSFSVTRMLHEKGEDGGSGIAWYSA